MERVIALLLIFSINFTIHSFPIENGFSVKFKPVSAKEDLRPRQFGTLFAKIPQDFEAQDEKRRAALSKAYYPYYPKKSELATGYTNQVAKVLFPTKYHYSNMINNMTKSWSNYVKLLNLPVTRQPYDDYKILVAAAPPNVNLGGDTKQTIIYVVFPNDESSKEDIFNIPTIYFVNEKFGNNNAIKKANIDPIIIIDSNRTVTGIKSKEVSKFVAFKNKLTNRFNYKLTR